MKKGRGGFGAGPGEREKEAPRWQDRLGGDLTCSRSGADEWRAGGNKGTAPAGPRLGSQAPGRELSSP